MKASKELEDAVTLGYWKYIFKYNLSEFLLALAIGTFFCTGYWIDDQISIPWIYPLVSSVWTFIAAPFRLWILWRKNKKEYYRWMKLYANE